MERQFKFAKGETVLCYYGGLLYSAKVMKCAKERNHTLKYYIHYTGWNKRWDEWVPERWVIKNTEENLRKQENLKKEKTEKRTLQRKPKGKKSQINDSKDSGSTSTSSKIQSPSNSNSDKPSTSTSNTLAAAEEDKPYTSTSNTLAAAEEDNGEPVAKRMRGRPLSKQKSKEEQDENNESDNGPSTSSYIIRKLFGLKRRHTDD